jgi:LacI family transcriptional regulator
LTLQAGRRSRGGVTIQDVAREAGVSPMTVSRVINSVGNVRPATRESVMEAIRRLRYAPNPAARSLAAGDFIRIGLLYGNPSAAYLSELLVGALDQAGRSNAQLSVEQYDDAADFVALAGRLVASGLDGVILPPPLSDLPDVLGPLSETGLRVVRIGGGPRPDVASVAIDDREAARRMTARLLELGHRRIGFLGGDERLAASHLRRAGYLDALAAAGLAPDPALQAPGAFTYRSGLEGAARLLASPNPPTAIFAANDDMAAGAIAAAHQRRLDVPQQLTVCGFDDSPIASAVWPELTTVRQPIADMARAAVEILCADVRSLLGGEPAPARNIVLDVELVGRGSDGPLTQS